MGQWDWKCIALEWYLIGLLFPQALRSFQRQEVWACSWSQTRLWLQELKLCLCFVFIIVMQIKMGYSTPGASVTFHFYTEQYEVSLNHLSFFNHLFMRPLLFILSSNQENHGSDFLEKISSNVCLDASFNRSWVKSLRVYGPMKQCIHLHIYFINGFVLLKAIK